MAAERLSRLQRRILTWLWAEAQRTRGTMAASHQYLGAPWATTRATSPPRSRAWPAKGLVAITRTSGGKAEAVDVTAEGRNRVAPLTER
jgi:hypothetical protein